MFVEGRRSAVVVVGVRRTPGLGRVSAVVQAALVLRGADYLVALVRRPARSGLCTRCVVLALLPEETTGRCMYRTRSAVVTAAGRGPTVGVGVAVAAA